jgi:hypothetical protein
MCLKTKTPEILIADKDIICYKESTGLQKTGGCYVSSPRNYQYFPGEIAPIVELKADIDLVFSWDGIWPETGNYRVEEGYHSHVKNYSPGESAVFLIPKGTKYISGWYNQNPMIKNYVSETIIFIGRDNKKTRFKLKLKALWNRITKK